MMDFKHIHAWQRARALAIALHRLAIPFARAGFGSLRGQLTRAGESISTNIVEGCGAATRREFARYLDIAIKSANETEHHLLVARDLGLVRPEVCSRHVAEVVEIRKMIYTYRKRVLESDTVPRQSAG